MILRLTACVFFCLFFIASSTLAASKSRCPAIFEDITQKDGVVLDFQSYQKLAYLDRALEPLRFKVHFDNINVLKTIFPEAQTRETVDPAGTLLGQIRFRIIGGKLKIYQKLDEYEMELAYPRGHKPLEIENNSISLNDETYDTYILKFDLSHGDDGYLIISTGTRDIVQAEVKASDGTTYVIFLADGLPTTRH